LVTSTGLQVSHNSDKRASQRNNKQAAAATAAVDDEQWPLATGRLLALMQNRFKNT
jgi:hypothetical protein